MNKTALITGASSGIGLELANIHAERGGDLILVARRQKRLEALKEELAKKHGVRVEIVVSDLSQPQAAQQIYQQVKEKNLEVHYLINNAGFGQLGRFEEMDWQRIQDMIQVNITSLTQLTHLFLKEMVVRNEGKILNVASSAGMVPGGPLMSVYYATKAYVLSFSKGLAGELDGRNVTVTALCPGATKTEFDVAANLQKSKLFQNVKFTARQVAEDGYNAMLKGQLVKTSALDFGTRLGLKLMPFVMDKIILRQIRSLQEERS